jgi:hypothetical protein
MPKRKRFHRCEGPFELKRDALIEAEIIRSAGHKATVKPLVDGGYKVCRTYKRRR